MNEPINDPKPNHFSPIALKKTLDIICGKWRLYIIYQIGTEVRRYGELRRMIPEVSEKVLIQELKALVELGVIEKQSYNEVPPRVEYSLTDTAKRILPQLFELSSIGEMFLNP
ncbi:winged helix-turn-helix transcriptional regulator [Spirosoma gilvum]